MGCSPSSVERGPSSANDPVTISPAGSYVVDQYRLWVFPLVIGSGERVFSEGTIPSGLKLVNSKVSSFLLKSIFRGAQSFRRDVAENSSASREMFRGNAVDRERGLPKEIEERLGHSTIRVTFDPLRTPVPEPPS